MVRKGLIVVIFALLVTVSFAYPAFAAFSDIPSTSTYSYLNKCVDDLVSKSVVTGYPDGTFRPYAPINRAQISKMVCIADAIPLTSAASADITFTDVTSNYWGLSYIKASCAEGLVKGYPDGTFKPEQPITRAELARVLCRAMGVPVLQPAGGAVFKDVSSSYWAAGYIATVTQYGVMGNYSDYTFRPAEPATRAQTAIAVYNMLHADLSKPIEDTTKDDGKIVVVIDPGHGGKDSGAVAKSNGLTEKAVNLAVGLKLNALLEKSGFTTIMTRKTDVFIELGTRAQIANEAHADIFVSIHHNSSTSESAAGTSVYSYPGSVDGAELAKVIQDELVKAFGWDGVSGKDDGTKTADFKVLRDTAMTAVLCESAFMSNPAEAKLLATDAFQQKEAQGIHNGIVKYFNQQ